MRRVGCKTGGFDFHLESIGNGLGSPQPNHIVKAWLPSCARLWVLWSRTPTLERQLAFAHRPSSPVRAQNLDPAVPPVAECEHSALARILAQILSHKPLQIVGPLAHVARLVGHKHLQAGVKLSILGQRQTTRTAVSLRRHQKSHHPSQMACCLRRLP